MQSLAQGLSADAGAGRPPTGPRSATPPRPVPPTTPSSTRSRATSPGSPAIPPAPATSPPAARSPTADGTASPVVAPGPLPAASRTTGKYPTRVRSASTRASAQSVLSGFDRIRDTNPGWAWRMSHPYRPANSSAKWAAPVHASIAPPIRPPNRRTKASTSFASSRHARFPKQPALRVQHAHLNRPNGSRAPQKRVPYPCPSHRGGWGRHTTPSTPATGSHPHLLD